MASAESSAIVIRHIQSVKLGVNIIQLKVMAKENFSFENMAGLGGVSAINNVSAIWPIQPANQRLMAI
jgi:hypothetical protein